MAEARRFVGVDGTSVGCAAPLAFSASHTRFPLFPMLNHRSATEL